MVQVLTWVVNAVFVLASIAALRLWVRHRSAATAWLLATFVVFDVVIAVSLLPETALDGGWPQKVLVVLLLTTPYLLFRFAHAVVLGPRGLRRLADGVLAVLVVWTLALPAVPDAEAAMAPAEQAWFVIALVAWGGLDVLAGGLLVRASVGEPGVVRNRLRVLAVAAIGLGLYIPASSLAVGSDPSPAAEVATQAVSMMLGLLFLVGFAPPALLRSAWRDRDERRLDQAAVDLMGATEPDDVAAVLVPGARALTGAPSVTMRSASGRVLGHDGADPAELVGMREVQERELGGGTLEIVVAPSMPIFGSDEEEHLDRLALLADLALDRVRLLWAERAARADVERLNAELESFVYTTSHDLKNPVIALLGYLDVLLEDHGDVFTGEREQILERMVVNARHMDALIRDLLALSRVGRVDVTPEAVDLELLLDDLARDDQRATGRLRLERSALPTLMVNATRARQLFTNLLDNAVAHGRRDEVRVRVTAEPLDAGVRLVVEDDGEGIPEAHLDRVFEVFERLDPGRPGGTGMGLAICRRIVEHLGGTLRAVPSSTGARFHVDLPADALAAGPTPPANPSPAGTAPTDAPLEDSTP